MKITDNNFYIGKFSGGDIQIENTSEAIAAFICEAGKQDDLVICTPDGIKMLTTIGIFIDRCHNHEILEELLVCLVPKQKEIEAQLGQPECP